jgi:hypothetical protein
VKWIAATACVLMILAIGLFYGRSRPQTFNVADASCTVAEAPPGPGTDTVVCYPDADAEALEYWKTARETCTREGVGQLAAYLEVRLPGPRPVARKYARWLRAPGGRLSRTADETKLRAVYEGCLRGFKDLP